MGNVLVKEETLAQIADAIREKSGSSDSYRPGEMPEAILEISTYSGEGADPNKPIRFYDPYGNLIYSYTVNEFSVMTELPPLPEYRGLIGQEWNWSLEKIKTVNGEVEIGSNYITDDGNTRIYVTLEGELNPKIGFTQSAANSVLIDWGDETDLSSSDIFGDEMVSIEHQYAKPGNYVICLIPVDGAEYTLVGDSYSTKILHKTTDNFYGNRVYGNAIRKIEIGKGITEFSTRCFNCASLESVTVPKEITAFGNAFQGTKRIKCITLPKAVTSLTSYAVRGSAQLEKIFFSESKISLGGTSFAECCSLKELVIAADMTLSYTDIFADCTALRKVKILGNITRLGSDMFSSCDSLSEVIFPENLTNLGGSMFSHCESLLNINIPESVKEIGATCFYYCYALKSVNIPEKVTKINANTFYCCYSLREITIPKDVTEIMTSAFGNCYGMEHYYILPETPPVLGNVNVFDKIPETCKIHVPKGCLEVYQTAEYWSEYADHMVEMEE